MIENNESGALPLTPTEVVLDARSMDPLPLEAFDRAVEHHRNGTGVQGNVARPIEGRRFMDILARHILGEIPISDLALTQAQKNRMLVVRECYMRFIANPKMTSRQLREHLKNGFGRTEQQVKDDMHYLNFVLSQVRPSSRAMLKMQANARIEQAAEIFDAKGDAMGLLKVAEASLKLNDLANNSPDQDDLDSMPLAEVVFTNDITRVDATRKHYDAKEVARIARKYNSKDERYTNPDE